MHKEAVGSECSVCHTSFPNKHLLEVRLLQYRCVQEFIEVSDLRFINSLHFLQKHTGSNGCRQTEFYCEECGKNIYSYNGLMVRWCILVPRGALRLFYNIIICNRFTWPNCIKMPSDLSAPFVTNSFQINISWR